MGCDIHIVLEHRAPNSAEWVGQWCSDGLPTCAGRLLCAERNYDVFAELAHVRGQSDTGTYPRNLPVDVSRLAWLRYMRAPTDYHSPSHMTPGEFAERWLRVMGEGRGVRPDYAQYDLFRIFGDEEGDWRLVFWFDN